jgi:hypothetical protein
MGEAVDGSSGRLLTDRLKLLSRSNGVNHDKAGLLDMHHDRRVMTPEAGFGDADAERFEQRAVLAKRIAQKALPGLADGRRRRRALLRLDCHDRA